MKIHKDECFVEAGPDGCWMLMDEEGREEICLPAGIAANKAAAEPLLMMLADAYNRGHGQGYETGRRDLQSAYHALMNTVSADVVEGEE